MTDYQTNLAFTWRVTELVDSRLQLQLDFAHPLEVAPYDKLHVDLEFSQI